MSFGTLAFTPVVRELQERYGSRQQYERMEKRSPSRTSLGEMEKRFLPNEIASTGQRSARQVGLTSNIVADQRGFYR